MYELGKRKGTIRFTIKPETDAKKILLAGDFSKWKLVRMRKQKDGTYVTVVYLNKPGTYEYRFSIDGKWISDPDNNAWAMNPFGTMNSVAKLD